MYVWLFALLFAMIFGALGYGSGAIRTAVALLGTLIALAVMAPLGNLLHGITDRMTADNLVLQYGLPYFLAFVFVWLAVYGLGFLAHHPVMIHFKYREDDATREGFNRVNQAGGLVIGLLIGMILFFAVGKRVYAGGYLTAQTTGEGANEPTLVKLGTAIRRHMDSSGWDKAFAALDETPARFYEISDMLGLLYENPAAHERLRDYPPYLEYEDKAEFTEFGAEDFKDLLKNKAGFSSVINSAHGRPLLGNQELVDALLKTDLKDLEAYLRTGVAPKYADEKILGRWRIDVSSGLLQTRRLHGTISPKEFAAMRMIYSAVLGGLRLKVLTDGRFVTSSAASKPAEGSDAAAAPVAAVPGPPAMDPSLSARYGIGRARPGAGGAPAVAAAPVAPATQFKLPKVNLNGVGSWKHTEGNKYRVKLPDGGGAAELDATINDLGRLVMPNPAQKLALVFVRAG
ncbi:MAG: CvpA family protein [Verrucomicrobia bacterium]|nr:MAG: CvpA family protein [Verrucomicrobiota bacterium]